MPALVDLTQWIVIADLFLYGEPLTLGEYTFPTWVNVAGTYAVIVAVKIMAAFALYHLHRCGYVSWGNLHDARGVALLSCTTWGASIRLLCTAARTTCRF